MQRIDENKVTDYIKKHVSFRKWLAFALCISLFTGTVTLYMMNKPATAMTEEGAQQVGLVLETADSAYEQQVIEQVVNKDSDTDGEVKKVEVKSESTDPAPAQATEGSGEPSSDNNNEGTPVAASTGSTDESASTSSSSEEVVTSSSTEASNVEEDDPAKETSVSTGASSAATESTTVSTGAGSEASSSASSASAEASSSVSTGAGSEASSSASTGASSAAGSSASSAASSSVATGASSAASSSASSASSTESSSALTGAASATTSASTAASTGTSLVNEETALTADIKLTVSYVDTKGEALKDEKEINISESLDFTTEAPKIEGYTFKEAAVGTTAITKITVKKTDDGFKYYEATLSDGTTEEIKEDKKVVLTYEGAEAEKTVVKLTAKYVDENGVSIADEEALEVKESLKLEDKAKEIDGYTFKAASLDGKEFTVITSKKDDKENIYFELTLKDETVLEVKEDKTLTLTYTKDSEVDSTIKLTAKYVDKDSKKLAEDKELNITKEKEFKKDTVDTIEGYFFMDVTFDGKKIAKITPVFEEETEVKDAASTNDTSKSDTAAAADEAETRKVKNYTFTTSDGEEITVDKDAEVVFNYVKATTQTEFKFEDTKVTVTATTKVAGAFPEGTQLKVTAVDKTTEGYNYDAYMEALNNNADEIEKAAAEAKGEQVSTDTQNATEADATPEADKSEKKYDETNTLLYDIAFMLDGVEFEPAEGAVSVSITFNNKQITEGLAAIESEDLTVIHLPLVEEVKEGVNSTSEATEIKADDVKVEVVKEGNISLEEDVEVVTFESDTFSLVAVVDNTKKTTSWIGNTSITAEDILSKLGKARYFGIVADSIYGNSHFESNVATNNYSKPGNYLLFDYSYNGGYINSPEYKNYEITVTKTSTKAGEFWFALFSDEAGKNKIADSEFLLKIDTNGGSKTSDPISAPKDVPNLYVYELDKQGGNAVLDSYGGFKVSYKSDITESSNVVDALISSYITNGNYSEGELDLILNNNSSVYFNAQADGWNKATKVGETKISPDKYNIPVTFVNDMRNDAAELSSMLANAVDNSTVKVFNVIPSTSGDFMKDFYYASKATEEGKPEIKESPYWPRDNAIKTEGGFSITDNQILVINLDLTGRSEYTIGDFVVNNIKSNDAYNNFNSIVSRIIINPVIKVDDEYVPFKGTIKFDDRPMGTFLAPLATVEESGFCGAVIAKNVNITGEIHKQTLVGYQESEKKGNVTITNTGINQPKGVIQKKWAGNVPDHCIYAYVCASANINGKEVDIPEYSDLYQLDKDNGWEYEVTFPADKYEKNGNTYDVVYRIYEVNYFKNGKDPKGGEYDFETLKRMLKNGEKNEAGGNLYIDDGGKQYIANIGKSEVNDYLVSYSSSIDASTIGNPNGANRVIYKTGLSDQTVTITNTQVTNIEVTKKWVLLGTDKHLEDLKDPGNIILKLHKSEDGGNSWKEIDAQPNTVDITTDPQIWKYTWKNLAKYAINGEEVVELEYKVVETFEKKPVGDEYISDSDGNSTNLITFTSTDPSAPGTATVINRSKKIKLHATKTVDGEKPKDNEEFVFELSRLNDSKDGWYYPDDRNISKKNSTKDGNIDFDFPDDKLKKWGIDFSKNSTYYFRIRESGIAEKTKGDFILDASWIITKVDKENGITYYMFKEGSEKLAAIEADPSLIPDYCTDELLIDESKATFNNHRSRKLVVKKLWKSAGTMLSDAKSKQISKGIDIQIYKGTDINNLTALKWNELSKGKYQVSESADAKDTLSIYSKLDWTLTLLIGADTTDTNMKYYVCEVDSNKEPVSSLVTYKSGKFVSSTWTEVPVSSENGELILTIENELGGNVLPSTGGVGEIPYMAVGLGTTVAALLGSRAYRKKKDEEDQE